MDNCPASHSFSLLQDRGPLAPRLRPDTVGQAGARDYGQRRCWSFPVAHPWPACGPHDLQMLECHRFLTLTLWPIQSAALSRSPPISSRSITTVTACARRAYVHDFSESCAQRWAPITTNSICRDTAVRIPPSRQLEP